ncbi:MAG: Zn-ribbon domain-containing OB-fold protein [Terriglobia bacterium]
MAGKAQTVRGTPLTGADLKKGKVFTTYYVPKIQYAWDTGEAIGHYLAELKKGRLVGRLCRRCHRKMIPPRMFCERCFRPTDEWFTAKPTGVVNTFSLCYVSWDVRRLKQPEIPAVIEIEGASPGMGILHVLGKVRPKDVFVGMKVRALWKPVAERTGSITDIACFEPLPGQRRPGRPATSSTARPKKARASKKRR